MTTEPVSRLERIVRSAIAHRWLVLLLTLGVAALGAWSYTQAADRCGARTSPTSRCRSTREAPRLLAARSRAAHHLPGRNRAGRHSEARLHALAVALRPVAGDGRLQGRHRHLLRAPAGRRADAAGEGATAGGRRARDGADRNGPRRDLPCTRSTRSPTRDEPDGKRWTPDRSAQHSGLGVRPQLRSVPGVTEVNTIGGFAKQIHVAPDPAKLLAYGLTLDDVVEARREEQRERRRGLHRAQRRSS